MRWQWPWTGWVNRRVLRMHRAALRQERVDGLLLIKQGGTPRLLAYLHDDLVDRGWEVAIDGRWAYLVKVKHYSAHPGTRKPCPPKVGESVDVIRPRMTLMGGDSD